MPDEWAKLVPQHMKLLQDQLDIANEMAADGRAVDAVLLLEKALAYHPENLGLLNNLAIALNRAGEPKKARAVVQRALKLNDHYLPGWITLSYSSHALGQNEAALSAADRAITLAPTTAQPHLAKANVLLGMERDQEALAELEAAFRCDPKNAEIQVELGDVCWRNLHLADEALNYYRSATNLNPTLLLAYLRLAEFNLDRGETNSAREIIQTAARVSPKNPDLVQLRERVGGAQEGK
jgi:tetratricopeptide (TPR) repeat protein